MRNLSLILVFVGAFAILAFSEFANGNFFGGKLIGNEKEDSITETINFDEINGLKIGISSARKANVYLTLKEGNNQKIEITAKPSIVKKFKEEAFVKDQLLKLDFDRNRIASDLYIVATINELKHLSIAGSSDIKTDGRFNNVNDLLLKISGSGDMNLDLGNNMDEIKTKISGSGNIILTGTAESLTSSIAGSGEINGLDLLTKNCKISIAGSGDCSINATESLTISIAGSGDVCYKGDPIIDKRIAGSGDINKCD